MTVRIAINKEAKGTPAAKAQRLTKIEVYEVSLVTSPAVPDATIAVMKSLDPVPVEKQYHREVGIMKIDAVKKQIYAYALVPDKEDLQGDICTKEDVEYAKNSFFKNLALRNQKGSGTGLQHQYFDNIGYPIGGDVDIDGSYGRMMGIAADKCIPGAWLLGIQVTDEEVWKKVESGEITGISIGCIGERSEVKAAPKSAHDPRGGIQKLLDGLLKKGGYVRVKAIDFNSSYALNQFYDECPSMWDSLLSAFWNIMYDENLSLAEKADAIEKSLTQFGERIRDLLGITEKGDIKTIEIIEDKTGGGQPSEQGEIEMQISEADLKKMIADQVSASVTEAVKKALEANKSAGSDAPKDLQKSIDDINAKLDKISKGEEGEFATLCVQAIQKLQTAITTIGKTVKGSQALPEDETEKGKKTEDVFKGTVFNFLRTDTE